MKCKLIKCKYCEQHSISTSCKITECEMVEGDNCMIPDRVKAIKNLLKIYNEELAKITDFYENMEWGEIYDSD